MEITILNIKKIENLPSGSGIVKSGDLYYAIGDDTPLLYSLDKDFNIIAKTPLLDSVNFTGERMLKSTKPDFESLEMVSENELIVFGSGSKSPERNVFARIFLKDSLRIEKYDVSELYSNLKNLTVLQDSELNIEATAISNKQIYLFNRKKNVVITFEYEALIRFIKGETPFPEPQTMEFSLPKINGIEAGFSGATVLKGGDKIIFTASVENTDNAYDDGEILGSFVGLIDIGKNKISNAVTFCQIPNNDANLKVESVTVTEEISNGNTKVVFITDDDKGNSILIKSMLSY